MKKFETPEIKIETFEVEDIITTSGNEDGGNLDNMTPLG